MLTPFIVSSEWFAWGSPVFAKSLPCLCLLWSAAWKLLIFICFERQHLKGTRTAILSELTWEEAPVTVMMGLTLSRCT